jgi:DNA-binding winged helix-turn-helix (wHTH) protein
MRYGFADCKLDTTSREFSRHGEAIHLSPKAYELLSLLIERRPAVLTKQQLMDGLWPGTFVVEANLPVLVGELRAAFGDKSPRDAVIKTHHGVGYSFVADVREHRSRVARGTGGRRQVVLAVDRRRIALSDGPNRVGRDEDCDVHLNDASVSRRHARLSVDGTAVVVEDLDSKNGTCVNGKRIGARTPVANGDTVTFGTVETKIVIARDRASTVTI